MSLPLKTREKQVQKLFDDGMSSYQIAQELGLAKSTVQEYRRRILAKLECPTTPGEIAAERLRMERAWVLARKCLKEMEAKLSGRR